MTRSFLIILFSIGFTFVACKSEKTKQNPVEEKQQPATPNIASLIDITLSPKKELYTIGNSIQINVSMPDTILVDSLELKFNSQIVAKSSKPALTYTLHTQNCKTGSQTLKLYWYSNGKKKSKAEIISLLSDIEPVKYSYKVINTFKHDKNAYTQGLIYYNDFFYEATGLKGKSSVRKVAPKNGEVLQSYSIPAEIFGEGITIIDKKIVQLSWQAQTGYVYDLETFELLEKFYYQSDGWGLTHNDTHLIMSDGSATLYFLETSSYSVVSQIEVFDNEGPVYQLNELEYINGEIYANIYLSDDIVRIDPKTGKVLGRIDCAGLLTTAEMSSDVDVLNGIAYDAKNKKLFVTGKKWPKLFEIQFIPQ